MSVKEVDRQCEPSKSAHAHKWSKLVSIYIASFIRHQPSMLKTLNTPAVYLIGSKTLDT